MRHHTVEQLHRKLYELTNTYVVVSYIATDEFYLTKQWH